jgi:hypothetical protein
VAQTTQQWQLTKLLPPPDTKHYLNCFMATMKQLAQQFINRPWKGHWLAFICLLGGEPTAPDWVTWTWFVSMDQMV